MPTRPPDTAIVTSLDLVIPPDPDLLRVVRLMASGVAAMTSLGLDAVEGVRVAADELISTLIQASDGGTITVTFELGHTTLKICARTHIDPTVEFVLDPLTNRILDAVVTSHDWQTEDSYLIGQVETALP